MNAPKGVTVGKLRTLLDQYFDEHCVLEGKTYQCRKCGGYIQYAVGIFEIHDEHFGGHAGPGKTEQLMLPYCSKCEGFPDIHGCIHVNVIKHNGVNYEKPCDRETMKDK